MMKKVSFLGLAMAAVLVSMTTSCQKDQDVVTLKATIEDYTGTDSKVYIDANDWAVWEDGDAVCVNDQLSLEISAGTNNNYTINDVTKSNSGYYAIYPANYVTDRQTTDVDGSFEILMPANQTYVVKSGHQIVKAPMVGYMDKNSSDGLLRFRNAAALLKLTVPQLSGYKVTFIEVKAENTAVKLSGDFTVTTSSTYNNGNGLSLTANSTGTSNSVALDCWNGGTGYDGGTFYIALPPSTTATQLTVTVYMQNTTDKKVYTYSHTSSSDITLTRNTIYPASFTFSGNGTQVYEYPDHTSVGIFSVSSSKKVRFTKGNLYNTAGTNTFGTWHLEANQYDYRTYGGKNANQNHSYSVSSSPSGHYGLFRFSSSDDDVNFGMTTSDNLSYSSGAFVDWGTNSIDNNESNYFCTLSSAEWSYLLTTQRQENNDYRYIICALHNTTAEQLLKGAYGLIIFPDNFTLPEGVTIANLNGPEIDFLQQGVQPTQINASYTANALASVWTALENAGCVFLPAIGYGKNGNVEHDVSASSVMWGHYWSSTVVNNDNAYRFYWCATHVNPANNHPKTHGRCVRLVVD